MRLPLPIILIILPVVLLVIFGKNPYKEAEMQWRKYGDDPLVAAVAIHNEKQDKEQAGFGAWFGGAPQMPVQNQPAQVDTTLPSDISNELLKVGVKDVAADADIGYYPPIAKSDKSQATPRITGEGRLRSGQKIEFEDMMVYTFDATGKRIPLPSGEYTLFDGNHITVENGARTTAN